jgi:sugar phosphate isomerase/epimerase
LTYCTNVHAGASWAEARRALAEHVPELRARVAPGGQPFGLGLWLGADAAATLAQPVALAEFRTWLEENRAYVFTLNGFPYGRFHGARVKENVYRPDWTERARLDHTLRLFDLLARLLPAGATPGSINTVPGTYKGFGLDDSARRQIFRHLAEAAAELDKLRDREGRDFVLGLEPEPLGLLETTEETVAFFREFWALPDTPRCAREVIGVTADCCHQAVEFEEPAEALALWRDAGVRLAKIHLSAALRFAPTNDALAALGAFDEPVYLHQVIVGGPRGVGRRFGDLPEALAWARPLAPSARGAEWRVHFHVPLHAAVPPPLGDTRAALAGVFDFLARDPAACPHLEMETYTWAVLPEGLRAARVGEQLAAEYAWTLGELRQRGLAE